MAKQTQKQEYSFEKYQYGALAARLLASNESSRYAPSALEVLAGSKGLNLGEEALGFIRGTQASEKGIQTAIDVYAGKFEEKRGQYKPVDMVAWYDSVLNDLDKADKAKILATLGKHNETIDSIMKKMAKASHIVQGKETGANTPEQISEAEATVEKYKNVFTVIHTLDNYKFETLRPEAVNTARKQDLKNLASKL